MHVDSQLAGSATPNIWHYKYNKLGQPKQLCPGRGKIEYDRTKQVIFGSDEPESTHSAIDMQQTGYAPNGGAPIFTYTHEPDDNEIHNGCKTMLYYVRGALCKHTIMSFLYVSIQEK